MRHQPRSERSLMATLLRRRRLAMILFVSAAATTVLNQAKAWGDEGHEIVALIADRFLDPAVKAKVHAMLASDTDSLTAHDIASEATWADKYRDSDRTGAKEHYRQTSQWHFIDIELDNPNVDSACFGHPALPVGTPAALGPPQDCIVDKINEFAAELADPTTAPDERLNALKFLLHLVGDLHQPLHASDHHDAGGNSVHVSAAGFKPGSLHHYWDTEFVERLGDDPKQVAADLSAGITQHHSAAEMAVGTPTDWAGESFQMAKDHAYGELSPPSAKGLYRLTPGYIVDAIATVQLQLARAGVRLAFILNRSVR